MKSLKTLILFAALALSAALALTGCPGKSSAPDKVVAEVGGDKIMDSELQRLLKDRISDHQGRGANVKSENLRAAVLDQMVSETLLLQGAREAGIKPDEAAVAAQMADTKKQMGEQAFTDRLKADNLTEADYARLLTERMMKERFADTLFTKDSIKEEMVRKYYKEAPKPFLKPATVLVRFIQIETQEAADKLIAELKAAGPKGFDAVADKAAKDNAAFVSAYGNTDPNMYSGEIKEGMKALKPGTFGGPYKGKEGYFILFLKSRTPEQPKSFEEAKPEIEQMLHSQAKSTAVIHWVAERKKKSAIKIY